MFHLWRLPETLIKAWTKKHEELPFEGTLYSNETRFWAGIYYTVYTPFTHKISNFMRPKRMKSRCLTIDELLWGIWPGSFVACFKSSLWPDHRITDVSFGPFPYAALVINVTQDQFSCGVTMSALKRGRKLRNELWNRQVWTMKCETLFLCLLRLCLLNLNHQPHPNYSLIGRSKAEMTSRWYVGWWILQVQRPPLLVTSWLSTGSNQSN